MINHKHKFIFIHINRTGGTSWERSFNIKSGHDHDLAVQIKKNVSKKVWNTYYKFAIVRNPWDRYLSIYKNRRTNQGRFKRYKTFKSWIFSLYNRFKKNGRLPNAFGNQLDWVSDKKGKVLLIILVGSKIIVKNGGRFAKLFL